MPPLQLRLRLAGAAGAARSRNLIGRRSPSCSNGRRTALVAVAAATRGGNKTATAADVVREFYDGVNRRDLAAVEPLIAEGYVYEDLVFPRPFVGRKQILGFFGEFIGSISPDLQFVIDDISGEDSAAVGVTWHLEWRGRPFPFSRGCSFYRLLVSEQRQKQIVYGRDCVEPAAEPEDSALAIIKGVTWILERFSKPCPHALSSEHKHGMQPQSQAEHQANGDTAGSRTQRENKHAVQAYIPS